MTIRHFKIFTTVCDTLNMTAAAEALYMSQSAVSQAVHELEQHYQVRLFERFSRKLYITEAGVKLLSYARHMLRIHAEIENDMKTLHQNGSIRIGASVTIGAYVLPNLISHFNQANPNIQIEVYEDNTEKIEKLLLTDQIDIGLVEGDTTSPDIMTQIFAEDELVVICGANHRFVGQAVIEPNDLISEKFIVREQGSGTRKTFESRMTANNLPWKAIWTCNNSDSIKMAVANGIGISVISARAVANDVSSGLLHQALVKDIPFKRNFKLIYHKNKYLTPSLTKFTEFCVEECGQEKKNRQCPFELPFIN